MESCSMHLVLFCSFHLVEFFEESFMSWHISAVHSFVLSSTALDE